ncbi:DNA-directed RNA polymerase III subunit RPC3 [Trichomonascus vanleenenianus]|uniref:DNA-directed RNA polymerase III subunit C82 n=1 Tax=Trichomonascus vanleenenianus TaxID=2268995 RepID=UPI003ECA253D
MSASSHLADFCKVVLRDVYGELAATILGVLFDYGRQTASQIAKRTKIPLVVCQRALVSLLQNRFLLYWSDEGSRHVYYSANWLQVYSVIWSGPILTVVNDKYGDDMYAEVVKNVLVYGNMKATDYFDAYPEDDSPRVKQIVVELLSKRILSNVTDHDFHPREDIYNKFFNAHKLKMRTENRSEAAKITAATNDANEELRQLQEDTDNLSKSKVLISKEKGSAIARQARLGEAVIVREVGPEVVLGVNYDKFLVVTRNQMLVDLANDRIGPVTAQVYKVVLDIYEDKIFRCSQEIPDDDKFKVSTREILSRLGPEVDVSGAASAAAAKRKKPGQSNGSAAKRRRTDSGYNTIDAEEEEDDDSDMDAALDRYDDDNMSDDMSEANGSKMHNPRDVDVHLKLLANSPLKFLTSAGGQGWHVPFAELIENAKRTAYDEIIGQKFGKIASRLLRLVREKGKMDEKSLSSTALVKDKDMQSYLSALQMFGGLLLQEIPRSNDRAPGRTYFLWYHKPKTAYSHLLQDLYQSMRFIYVRLIAEREKHSILRAKLSREDVKGQEEKYLSLSEKKEWMEMKKQEEKLLVQLVRMDSLVRLFRDY